VRSVPARDGSGKDWGQRGLAHGEAREVEEGSVVLAAGRNGRLAAAAGLGTGGGLVWAGRRGARVRRG
jgi:hypothetical protein